MSKVKQILAGVLSASMIVTLMPAVTFAAPTKVTYTDSNNATIEVPATQENPVEYAINAVWSEGTVTVTGGTIDNSIVIDKNTGFTLVLDGATLAEGVTITADEGTTATPKHPCLVTTSNGYIYHPTHKFINADGKASEADVMKGDIHLYCQYGCAGVNTTATAVTSTTANPNPYKEEGGFAYYNATLDEGWAATQYLADQKTTNVVYTAEIGAVTTTYQVGLPDYQKNLDDLVASTSPVQFFANLQSSTGGAPYADVIDTAGHKIPVAGTIKETNKLTVDQIDALVASAATGGTKVYVVNKGTDGKTTVEATKENETRNYAADTEADANTYGTHSYKVEFTLDATYGGTTFTCYVVNVVDESKKDAVKAEVAAIQALYADEDENEIWSAQYVALAGETDENRSATFNFTDQVDTATGLPYVTIPPTGDTKYYLVLSPTGSFSYRPVYRTTKKMTTTPTAAQIAKGEAVKVGDDYYETIFGETETYAPDTTSELFAIYSCGSAVLPYAAKAVFYKNDEAHKNVRYALSTTRGVRPLCPEEHTADNVDAWAGAYTANPDHETPVDATIICKICKNSYKITFPKTSDHTYVLGPDSITPKETTVEATCLYPGFKYNECLKNNGTPVNGKDGWVFAADGKTATYAMTLTKKYSYTFTAEISETTAKIKDANGNVVKSDAVVTPANGDTPAKIGWHPVLVAGSVGEIGDHSLRLTTIAPDWSDATATKKLEDDVTCVVREECEICGTQYEYTYHKLTFDEYKKANPTTTKKLDEGSTDTITGKGAGTAADPIKVEVFGKVTYTVTEGADCSKPDKFVYSIENVVPGKTISSNSIESSVYYGPHKYTNSVIWNPTGEDMAAHVMQQCTVAGCKASGHKDIAGNESVQTVDAVVTSTENADGSTTYTATLLGQTLTDNTKTAINLAKAVVTVNGGQAVDLNNYTTAASIEDLVTVAVNGVEIDPKEWKIEKPAAVLVVGNNTIKIVPEVETATYTPIAVNSKEATFACTKLPTMEIATVRFDGNLSTSTAFDPTITYDTEAHPFEVTLKDSTTKRAVEDATIEYLAIGVTRELNRTTGKYTYEFVDLDGNDITDDVMRGDFSNLEFVKELSLVDAGAYEIYVKMSKDGYSTQYALAAGWDYDDKIIDEKPVEGFDPFYDGPIVISPFDTKATLTVNKQLLTYGEELIATTGDADIDEMIGLTTVNTSKLNVGEYAFTDLVQWDWRNYEVTPYLIGEAETIKIEKRNATLIMTESSKTYDGKPVDKTTLFKIDGLVNDDQPEVIVSTAGNKDILDVGTYTLVATVNDSNYVIEKVTATYTVNPASIAGAKVVLAKTSYTYTGKALKPAVKSVTLKDGTVLAASDYTVAYKNNTNVGTATATVTGKGNYTGTATATFKITAASLKGATVTLAKKSVTYNGKAQKVAVKSVKLKDGTVVPASNYTVTYKNNKNAGKATVTVTGKANYTGTATANFTITKAANTLAVSKATRTSSNNQFTKKGNTKKTRRVSGLKVTNKGQGTITYKKVKVNKNGSKFQVNAKTGKITIYKGTPKGTYQVTVSATAAGNKNYKKSAAKTAVVTIVVK